MKWETSKDASSSPTSPRRLAQFSRRVWHGYWQVFGLAGVVGQADRSFYWPIFPVLEKTSGIGAFDPAYRCGAVPDLHRVPFRRSRWGAPPANEPQDRGLLGSCQSKCCVSVKVSERKNTIDIEFRPIWLVALRTRHRYLAMARDTAESVWRVVKDISGGINTRRAKPSEENVFVLDVAGEIAFRKRFSQVAAPI